MAYIPHVNAYLVDAGQIDVIAEYIDYWARKETTFLVDLVFAETRGQARATFAHRHRMDIEFTDIKSVRLMHRNVDRQRGIADDRDLLWEIIEYQHKDDT